MNTMMVICDTMIAGAKENLIACPAGVECVNTNYFDVVIVWYICLTIIILAIFMLVAFLAKLYKPEKTETRSGNGDVPGQTGKPSSDKDKEEDHEKYREKLVERFLSFCESQIREGKDQKGVLLTDYKNVIGKYLSELRGDGAQAGEKDSKISEK